MRHFRIAVGLFLWTALGVGLYFAIEMSALSPHRDGGPLADELWRFTSGKRTTAMFEVDAYWRVAPGDPIYRIDGPDAVRQIGEIRQVLPAGDRSTAERARLVRAEAMLYPMARPLNGETTVTFYTTPTSMSWVMETMLPPERRAEIGRAIATTYETYHTEILQALKPIIVAAFLDAVDVIQDDLSRAVSNRRDELERLGTRYQQQVVEQNIVPLVRSEIWPIVRRHAEPLANQIGEEMWRRASVWRFGWRYLYDVSPLPQKNLLSQEWQRFLDDEGIPVLNQHSDDIVAAQRQILSEVAQNDAVRRAVRENLARIIDDPEFRTILWEILQEVLVDNPRLRATLEQRWRGREAQRAVQLAAQSVEPCVRRIGDLLFGTREEGITPEFAQVLRNQILDKDCRWFVVETPESTKGHTGGAKPAEWRVVRGRNPQVNPFAVQLRGGR